MDLTHIIIVIVASRRTEITIITAVFVVATAKSIKYSSTYCITISIGLLVAQRLNGQKGK